MADFPVPRFGETNRCFVIAEAGVNHDGELGLAHRLVDVAAEAGADAVKFQTFSANRLASATARKANYQAANTGSSESQRDMLRRLELTSAAHVELKEHAEERGLIFLSTPFDEESADFLDELGVPLFKIPSGELTNIPYLEHIAKKGRTMLVSTGMATLREVAEAVEAIEAAGAPRLVLLQCVSNYPAAPADVNLRAMQTMAEAFHVPVGYSDHTMGTAVSIAAVALGACVIEKHFTLDRGLPGPDHKASLEPEELKALVAGIRSVEEALGDGRKRPSASEADTAAAARKSLVFARSAAAGEMVSAEDVVPRRPGTGFSPGMLPFFIGRRLSRNVEEGEVLTLEDFD